MQIVDIVVHIYPPVIGQRSTLTVARSAHFHCINYFMFGGIRTSYEFLVI